jgi:hypothetical protein
MKNNNKKSEVIEIIKRNFKDIYCDTCNGKHCENCYRKNINYEVSDDFAEIVANEILEELL